MRNDDVRFCAASCSQRSSGSSQTGTSSGGHSPATAAQTSTAERRAGPSNSASTSASSVRSAWTIGAPPISAATVARALRAAVVVDDDVGALGRELARARGADAAGRAGHEHALACEAGLHEAVAL